MRKRARRIAAGHLCLALFALSGQISHQLKTVASTKDTGLGMGLNEAEREFVLKKAMEFHRLGEVLRKLGWRFLG